MAVASSLTRYRPRGKIASGGMATISLAEDTVLGRPVALKRLRGTASRDGVSRLRREALMGASVSHPNLVAVYDVVTENDDVVIVMEYVDGWTLKDAVARGERLPPREAMRILTGVASALDAIHARGIVHRDVKPGNILLGRGGEVKLADLGIAAAPDHTSITTEGSVLGSFSYMAPEQLEGASATPAMDVYALAAVAFEALGGRRAQLADNPLALAHAIATQPPPDLKGAWPEAPPEAAALLKRGMSRDPEERPRSAGELVAALGPALAGQGDGLETTRVMAPPPLAAPLVAPPVGPPSDAPPRQAPPLLAGHESERYPRRSSWLAPLLLGLVALAVLAAVLGSGGGAGRTAGHRRTSNHAARKARATSSRTTRSTTGTGSPSGPGGNATPVGAVERFYELAASHQFAAAWALADSSFRNQLGGYDSFVAGQQGDRRIIFNRAQVTNQTSSSATVAIATTSIRTNGTQQCAGIVKLVPGGGGWLLDQIGINCQPAGGNESKPPHDHGKGQGNGNGHGGGGD